MARNKVTKCICYKRSFVEVIDYAEKQGLSSVDELKNHDFCSNSCGLCAPYVEKALETGQVEFSPGEPFRKKRNTG